MFFCFLLFFLYPCLTTDSSRLSDDEFFNSRAEPHAAAMQSPLKVQIQKKKEHSNGQESIQEFNICAQNKGTVITFHLNLALSDPRWV